MSSDMKDTELDSDIKAAIGWSNPQHRIRDVQALIKRETDKAVQEAQTNAVAWCIMQIDAEHITADPKHDREYKGIKNKLRDLCKAFTGVDPAPTYPVHAQLKQQQTRGDEG